MKNWLIKKLGGYLKEEIPPVDAIYALEELVKGDMYATLIKEKERISRFFERYNI